MKRNLNKINTYKYPAVLQSVTLWLTAELTLLKKWKESWRRRRIIQYCFFFL